MPSDSPAQPNLHQYINVHPDIDERMPPIAPHTICHQPPPICHQPPPICHQPPRQQRATSLRAWLVPTYRVALVALAAACGSSDGSSDEMSPVQMDAAQDASSASPDAPDAVTTAQCTPSNTTALALERVAEGFRRPVLVTAPRNDPRLFVVEQRGLIYVVRDGTPLETPFVDLRGIVNSSSNEQGLLGLAFAPDYATSGRFFVHYTAQSPTGDGVVAEYTVSNDPDIANVTEARLLTVDQPLSNHNGGSIEFGPDGLLYWALGDGGGANDPLQTGQDPNSRLGSILRLDVSTPGSASEPATNPFVNSDGDPYVFAYGVRNVWRMSFDRDEGDLYFGDVGQDAQEEVSVLPAGTSGGQNYGWRVYEGNACRPGQQNCAEPTNYVPPMYSYAHTSAGECSVVGGYVYRGSCLPEVKGTYFFADYCTAKVSSVIPSGNTATNLTDYPTLRPPDPGPEDASRLASFGQDGFGELYITTFDGVIYRIVAAQ